MKTITSVLMALLVAVSFSVAASAETSCEMLNRAGKPMQQAHFDKAIHWANADLLESGINVDINDLIYAYGSGVREFIEDDIAMICRVQPSADTWDIALRTLLKFRKLQLSN